MNAPNADHRALGIAQHIHRISGARQTFLFGSRARGDHRKNSDVDLLIIMEDTPANPWLEDLRQRARRAQKDLMPEASGIDVICMSEPEFLSRMHLRNNMANNIAKEGCPVTPDERFNYGTEHEGEEVDWEDVEQKINDATGAASWIEAMLEAGILDAGDNKQFGRVAQNALEFAYKAVIGAHGHEYPDTGRDGHNLRILTDLFREHGIIRSGEEAPGENHHCLTEFGRAAVYAHEHPHLDRRRIAEDIPEAVARLRDMAESARITTRRNLENL